MLRAIWKAIVGGDRPGKPERLGGWDPVLGCYSPHPTGVKPVPPRGTSAVITVEEEEEYAERRRRRRERKRR